MTQRSTRSRGLGRVALYYLLFAVVLVLGVRYVPMIAEAVSGGRLDELANAEAARLLGSEPPVGAVADVAPWDRTLLAVISMLGALGLMIPVTWVYMVTRRHRGYDESVVHTLLILPVAVTGIVMIVQNSVALAFSLAGIVAAVRFRTTLEDTKDAVYVFLAIGVGLASGVQALGVALVLSVFFNLVVLALWQTRFGNIYADQNARAGALSLGDVAAGPASAASALQVGDPAVLEATPAGDLAAIAERAVRVERYITEERKRKKSERANTLIMVHASAAEPAQRYVDEVLGRVPSRHKLVEIAPGPRGQLLEYLARLDDDGVKAAVMDQLRTGHDGAIAAAELRSLKGLKPRA